MRPLSVSARIPQTVPRNSTSTMGQWGEFPILEQCDWRIPSFFGEFEGSGGFFLLPTHTTQLPPPAPPPPLPNPQLPRSSPSQPPPPPGRLPCVQGLELRMAGPEGPNQWPYSMKADTSRLAMRLKTNRWDGERCHPFPHFFIPLPVSLLPTSRSTSK